MIHLDQKQHNFLIHISKSGKIIYKELSDEQIKIANFLEENNLIDVKYEAHLKYDWETRKAGYNFGKRLSATISEAGKAYLSEKKHLAKEKWIPYIITTVISVLALMKSYGFGIDDIITLCMQLLRQSPQ
ncbi:MAG: hypothetical protein J1E64_04905 [Acetatifactor sp.]|nr:hypothetical protein [Acetatifactor sp.]